MVTPSPVIGAVDVLAARVRTAHGARTPWVGARVAAAFVRGLCRLRGGHDHVLTFDSDRLSLRCVSCGHVTPGWTIDGVPPTVTAPGGRGRHQVVRIAARRLA